MASMGSIKVTDPEAGKAKKQKMGLNKPNGSLNNVVVKGTMERGQSNKGKKRTREAGKAGSSSACSAASSRASEKSTTQKQTSAIDDMFAELVSKKKRDEAEKQEAYKVEKGKTRAGNGAKKGTGNRQSSFDHDPKPVRFDSELGLRIYSEESLNIGKGGKTELCPFDCNCCF